MYVAAFVAKIHGELQAMPVEFAYAYSLFFMSIQAQCYTYQPSILLESVPYARR